MGYQEQLKGGHRYRRTLIEEEKRTGWIVVAVLVTLWAIGFAADLSGPAIHLLLVVAALVLIVNSANRRTEAVLDRIAPDWRYRGPRWK